MRARSVRLSLFVTFEGPEGGGKTTQIRLLGEYLRARGLAVLVTREPGGSPVSEQIRQVILSKRNLAIAPETEALLFSAARAQIVAELIRPALAAGKIVLCDRFADSTMAYQGYGLGLDLDALRAITRFATGGLTPDLTVYLDLPVEMGIARKRPGEVNRLDQKEIAYHQRVRAGFLELIQVNSPRWVTVDATRSTDAVQKEIRGAIEQRLQVADGR